MKLIVTVKSAKGFYDEAKITGPNLKSCLDKILPALDDMPDEINNVKMADWTYMFIEIQK